MKNLTRYNGIEEDPDGVYYKVSEIEEALRSILTNKSSPKLPKIKEVVDWFWLDGGKAKGDASYRNGIIDCYEFIAGKIGR